MDATTISVCIGLLTLIITLGSMVITLKTELKGHITHTRENHEDHKASIEQLNNNYRADINHIRQHFVTELEKAKLDIKGNILELRDSNRHETIQFTEALASLNNTLHSIHVGQEQLKSVMESQKSLLTEMKSDYKELRERVTKVENA